MSYTIEISSGVDGKSPVYQTIQEAGNGAVEGVRDSSSSQVSSVSEDSLKSNSVNFELSETLSGLDQFSDSFGSLQEASFQF